MGGAPPVFALCTSERAIDLSATVSSIAGIAFDDVDGLLYVADPIGGKVVRVRMGGSFPESIWPCPEAASNNCMSGCTIPQGVAVDSCNGQVFIADSCSRRIIRSELNGTNAIEIARSVLMDPQGIAVDPTADPPRVYWMQNGNSEIYSADYDGGNRKQVVNLNGGIYRGIALLPHCP